MILLFHSRGVLKFGLGRDVPLGNLKCHPSKTNFQEKGTHPYTKSFEKRTHQNTTFCKEEGPIEIPESLILLPEFAAHPVTPPSGILLLCIQMVWLQPGGLLRTLGFCCFTLFSLLGILLFYSSVFWYGLVPAREGGLLSAQEVVGACRNSGSTIRVSGISIDPFSSWNVVFWWVFFSKFSKIWAFL